MTDPADERDLDELLAPQPADDMPGLRDAILRATQRQLVVRKWVRRAAKAAAVAAAFAAGVGVSLWRAPSEREKPVPVPPVEVAVVPVPVGVPVVIGSPAAPQAPAEQLSAARLELNAEQADNATTAAKLYREAGDKYLNDQQDYANAVRCYRLFLARAGDPALSPEPGDSWLLTSLKNAAYKEKVNATHVDG